MSSAVWGTRCVDAFQKLAQVGEGNYGQVYQARSRETGAVVALKKIRLDEREGFPVTALREMNILRRMNHPNVLRIHEVVMSKAAQMNNGVGSVYMVLEYMDHDLQGLMESEFYASFTLAQKKSYMLQLARGVAYCHREGVMHRDLKAANLLVSNEGILKVGDFGLAQRYSRSITKYSNRVITLAYRPPELLLGADTHDFAVDVWSMGAIFAELLTGRQLFVGRNEVEVFRAIYARLGSTPFRQCPYLAGLPWLKRFLPAEKPSPPPLTLDEELASLSAAGRSLLQSMLQADPARRPSAEKVVADPYFLEDPLPAEPSSLPTYPSSHNYSAS